MASPAQRRSDIQLMVVTASLLVGAAVLVAVGLLVVTRGADSPECGLLPAGSVVDKESLIEEGGPILQTGGGSCSYWVDQPDDLLVAYRVRPRDRNCSVEASTGEDLVTVYTCGGVEVDPGDLDRYATWHALQSDVEILLVDLRPDRPCGAYELGKVDGLTDRLRAGGAVLIDTPDCGRTWLALDQSGVPTVVVARVDECIIERDLAGELTCNGRIVGVRQIPAFATTIVAGDEGDRLLVDLSTPSGSEAP